MIDISYDGLTSWDFLDSPGAGVASVPAKDRSKINSQKKRFGRAWIELVLQFSRSFSGYSFIGVHSACTSVHLYIAPFTSGMEAGGQ